MRRGTDLGGDLRGMEITADGFINEMATFFNEGKENKGLK